VSVTKKPHSRDLVSAVLFLKLTAAEKLVLMAICWHYPRPYPSVARIAAMSSQSKRWVRQCLRSLQKKGLIEVHYRRDGQAQDTSFYTINPDRILMQAGKRGKTTLRAGGSEFRGGGNSVPGGGEEVSTPKQSALDRDKTKSKIVSKNLANKAIEQPCQEKESASKEDHISQKDGRILTDPPSVEINPCQEEIVDCNSNESTHPQPPSSALPPSPSRPALCADNVSPGALTAEEAFKKALRMAPHPGEHNLKNRRETWHSRCKVYGVHDVLQAFEYFLKTYPHLANQFGQPITTFLSMGREDDSLIKEMRTRQAGASAPKVAASKGVEGDILK